MAHRVEVAQLREDLVDAFKFGELDPTGKWWWRMQSEP